MKVVSSKQMASIETLAFKEGASELDFMEEAGSGIALVVHDYVEMHNSGRNVILLCGQGNNGGDAYVAGINLLALEYQVTAYQLFPINTCSHLCQQHHNHFLLDGGKIVEVQSIRDIALPEDGIIVDGIFGTGFHGTVDEPIAAIIDLINQSNLPIIAVDIPSGLNGNTGEVNGKAVIATETAFLGLPKIGFMMLS
ncbi:MAG: NAD(P)H-hydrate epimerase, partial [Parachlamydiaceae bacterium]|nr:NAD(P)H-hydrate epimerase [Parachlamydiaceae bacterium]